jgi:hypothetical protein
VDSEDWEVVPH